MPSSPSDLSVILVPTYPASFKLLQTQSTKSSVISFDSRAVAQMAIVLLSCTTNVGGPVSALSSSAEFMYVQSIPTVTPIFSSSLSDWRCCWAIPLPCTHHGHQSRYSAWCDMWSSHSWAVGARGILATLGFRSSSSTVASCNSSSSPAPTSRPTTFAPLRCDGLMRWVWSTTTAAGQNPDWDSSHPS